MRSPLGNGPYIKTPWFRKVKSSFHAHKRVAITFFCMAFTIGLMFLSCGEFAAVQKVRADVTDFLMPVVRISRAPQDFIKEMQNSFYAFIYQKDKILYLQEENKKLQEAQILVRQIQKENMDLQAILKIPQDKYKIVAHARVLSYPGAPYVKSILLGIGKQQGVAPLQPVITPYGLVGRVTDVGENSCRVILMTDLNAHIPVVIKPGNVHAILTGNNTEIPRLKYIQDVYGSIGIGDRVETSASGGVFPAGIPIGTVKKIDGEHVLIKPEVDLENLSFVTIVKTAELTEILGGES